MRPAWLAAATHRYGYRTSRPSGSHVLARGNEVRCAACCQSFVAQTACRLLSLCMLRLADCMPHVTFCLSTCQSHVHIACCRPHATRCAFARCALWTVCQILPLTLSSSLMYVVSCVQSTVLRALLATCCLLPVALCPNASNR